MLRLTPPGITFLARSKSCALRLATGVVAGVVAPVVELGVNGVSSLASVAGNDRRTGALLHKVKGYAGGEFHKRKAALGDINDRQI